MLTGKAYRETGKVRFSDRADDYRKYRPSYPEAIIGLLMTKCGLNADASIADIGSGTGIFTAMLLDHFSRVYAVEPNEAMRKTAEDDLSYHPHFISINGSAEETNLPSGSVNLVIAAQAFHWFDQDKTRLEFKRIVTGEKWVALIWNERMVTGNGFEHDYNNLLQTYASDYLRNRVKMVNPGLIEAFYKSANYELLELPNQQIFTLESLKGRLLSSSYVPKEGQPGHDEIMKEATRIFDANQINGTVTLKYTTRIHLGKLLHAC